MSINKAPPVRDDDARGRRLVLYRRVCAVRDGGRGRGKRQPECHQCYGQMSMLVAVCPVVTVLYRSVHYI
jgi:hypothetical protein